MINFVDLIAAPERWLFHRFAKPADYVLHEGPMATIDVWVRRVRSEDLFAAAMQQDQAAVLDAAEFKAAFATRDAPTRFDRIRTPDGRSYAIEELGGAPGIDPVFFKCRILGGQQ